MPGPRPLFCTQPLVQGSQTAAVSPRARLQPFAYFRSSWVGPQQSDRRGVYRCHAVHGHGYADEQVERLLLAPEMVPVVGRGRLVGPDFVG